VTDLDFDQLYDRHALEVYRYIARRHIGNDAQDLTGDVFLIALQKLDSIPVVRSYLGYIGLPGMS
jgi:DNA-directed RNA polymerase specialized sigma24 family protein